MARPMKKTYLAVILLPKGGLFCQFVERKIVGLMPKVTGDTYQVFLFFSLCKIKINQ